MEDAQGQVKRRSTRREAVYAALAATDAHPTAEELYAIVKVGLPDIGIATVYRNLAQLEREGRVTAVETVSGRVRYDADVSAHAHFVCEKCHRVIDLDCKLPGLNKDGYTVSGEKLVYYGTCPECGKHS